jgi:outer membrane immunogenic protein
MFSAVRSVNSSGENNELLDQDLWTRITNKGIVRTARGGSHKMKLPLRTLGASVALASTLGTSAALADIYYIPRASHTVPAELTWTGLYIGGHVGAAWADVQWADVSLTAESVNNDSAGFFGGGHIGYNLQLHSFLLGVEASLSGAVLTDNARSAVVPATISYGTNTNTIATATGRLGVVFDRWLVYGKGGWAGAQVEVSGRDTALPDSFSFGDWRSGWTVGGGFEYKFQPYFSIGAEYGFIDLGSETITGVTALGLPVTITNHDVQIQAVTTRLNYHF